MPTLCPRNTPTIKCAKSSSIRVSDISKLNKAFFDKFILKHS